MVQVVVDDRLPGPVGLHPRFRVAGGARGELQETRRVFIHIQAKIVGAATGLQPRERHRPCGAVGADADKMPDGLELVLVTFDVRAEAGVEISADASTLFSDQTWLSIAKWLCRTTRTRLCFSQPNQVSTTSGVL